MAEETNIAEVTEEVTADKPAENTENAKNTETAEIPAVEESAETAEVSEISEVSEEKTAARNLRKERIGIVVSNKMQKTAVVKIEERITHSRYSKIMKRSIKFKVHDENDECDIGDKVLIMETRPLSRDKRWRLVKILEKVK